MDLVNILGITNICHTAFFLGKQFLQRETGEPYRLHLLR
jgi:hypothetical protein